MSIATLERLPNTVTACHAEIRKLREARGGGTRTVELEGEVAALRLANEALEKRIEELEENENPDAIAAIDNFLFEVQRPVGQFKFDVLHGPAADRAIVGLYGAVGRQP